jgi:5-methylthioadenosine/S-adenosylhomocysteine deaminase
MDRNRTPRPGDTEQQLYFPSYLFIEGGFRSGSAVLVGRGTVASVGDRDELAARYPAAERVDWSGLAMLPGTVNTHCHSFQSLLRGFVVDEPFQEWRDQALYRYTPYLDAEGVYVGALLAFGEMLRYGVTTVADFFYIHRGGTECDEAVIRAARDLGVRLVFARTMYDWDGAPEAYQETVHDAVERTRRLAIAHQGNPMVTVCPAPHSLHAASLEMVLAGHRLARELGTRWHMHIAEEPFEVEQTQRDHGCRPVELLHRLGVVDDSLVAVHLVWLADAEIELLGERGAKLAYCPSSNMFLADGVTRVPELLRAGVIVGLGTDGACSNNRNTVFEEMRMAALLQKVQRLDATALTAEDVFAMGTRRGASVLDLPVGEIAPRLSADFVGIDLSSLSLQPAPAHPETLLAGVVYGMQPEAVARVVVAGREVVRNGALQTVPQADIIRRAQAVVSRWPDPGGSAASPDGTAARWSSGRAPNPG